MRDEALSTCDGSQISQPPGAPVPSGVKRKIKSCTQTGETEQCEKHPGQCLAYNSRSWVPSVLLCNTGVWAEAPLILSPSAHLSFPHGEKCHTIYTQNIRPQNWITHRARKDFGDHSVWWFFICHRVISWVDKRQVHFGKTAHGL